MKRAAFRRIPASLRFRFGLLGSGLAAGLWLLPVPGEATVREAAHDPALDGPTLAERVARVREHVALIEPCEGKIVVGGEVLQFWNFPNWPNYWFNFPNHWRNF